MRICEITRLCEPREALATICDQHDAGRNHRIECLVESLPVEFSGDPIVRRLAPVARDENDVVVFSVRTGFSGIPPRFLGVRPGRSRDLLLGFADQGLVSFDDTGEDRRSLIPCASEEPVTLAR